MMPCTKSTTHHLTDATHPFDVGACQHRPGKLSRIMTEVVPWGFPSSMYAKPLPRLGKLVISEGQVC